MASIEDLRKAYERPQEQEDVPADPHQTSVLPAWMGITSGVLVSLRLLPYLAAASSFRGRHH